MEDAFYWDWEVEATELALHMSLLQLVAIVWVQFVGYIERN